MTMTIGEDAKLAPKDSHYGTTHSKPDNPISTDSKLDDGECDSSRDALHRTPSLDERHGETIAVRKLADGETKSRRSQFAACVEFLKYCFSSALLLFSLVLVMAGIFTEQTVGTAEKGVNPWLACFLFYFLICWLGMMEGGQGCLVGLQPIPKELYAESHPRTLANTSLVHKGDNIEGFIVGRQFLVVLVLFVLNMVSSAAEDVDIWGMSEIVQAIFVKSDLALMLVTIMIGQLTAQVNAANCMLDFINNYFMLYFVTYISLVIEYSGLLHSAYLVQIIFGMLAGSPVGANEPTMSPLQNFFFWGRVFFSLAILSFAFAVTLAALFDGKTTAWEDIPSALSVGVFFILMCFVGLMEGMQIALFAVVNFPEEELEKHPIAHKSCRVAFYGQNLQAFLIGRQICVTICTFIIAKITTLNVEVGAGDNIFGVSDGIQSFFNTGLLGALITTIVSSLAWRVIASSFPLAFMSNPLIYLILRLCLILESSGLCSAAWILASIQRLLVGLKPDEEYIGTPKQRTGKQESDEIELGDLELQEETDSC